jgi:hypothetical protein
MRFTPMAYAVAGVYGFARIRCQAAHWLYCYMDSQGVPYLDYSAPRVFLKG